MATRKTTTRGKTKTSTAKKTTRAAATTRRKTTAAAKTTKVTKVTKSTKTTAAKTTKVTSVVSRLRNLHVVTALVTLGLAVIAGMFMTRASAPVHVGYLAPDALASKTTTVFAPAAQSIFDVQYRWLVIVPLAFTALYSLLTLTRMRARYEKGLNDRVMPMRWVDMAITSALLVETVALLSGVGDLMTLKLVGALMATTCILGWIAERQNQNVVFPVWGAYVASLFTGFMPWVLLAGYAISTWVYGLIRYPWYVYALYGALFVGFGLFALTQFLHISRRLKDYATVERNYLFANLAVKAAFAAILILGFQK